MTRPVLLDGAIGGELRNRLGGEDTALLPATANLDAPGEVERLHRDYIAAGARVITTNTYATVRQRLPEDRAARWGEMVLAACRAARGAAPGGVRVAGSLPPLHGSYRPEGVGDFATIKATYAEHAALMEPLVDLFICETMTTPEEARAAAEAASAAGRPVWVSWCLRDDGLLRSGETLAGAWAAVRHTGPEAVLVNCCAPEVATAAMGDLARMGPPFGAYSNAFGAIPAGWTIRDGISALGTRADLTPDAYAMHVRDWLDAGATIAGGCCGIGPAHVAALAATGAFGH